jgi:hypothetical protein
MPCIRENRNSIAVQVKDLLPTEKTLHDGSIQENTRSAIQWSVTSSLHANTHNYMGEIYIIYKVIITTCGLIGSRHFSRPVLNLKTTVVF